MVYDKLLLSQINQLQMTALTDETPHQRLIRIDNLLTALGNPHQAFDTIHITGTSGKGSVVAILQALLTAHGLRVGTFTSPHLQTPLERIQIDGHLISPELFAAVAPLALNDKRTRRYVEGWFSIAMLAFAEAACDVAIIEVGTGGRFSSTNVITPTVTVINSIGYDHMDRLGYTLEEIAWHKAGIIKRRIPCVMGAIPDACVDIIEKEAWLQSTTLIRMGTAFDYEILAIGQQTDFTYKGIDVTFDNLSLSLRGGYQAYNAATALATLELYLRAKMRTVDEAAIYSALRGIQFAGRLEQLQAEPVVVIDGAHNEQKLQGLFETIGHVFDYERLLVVLGMMQSKELGEAGQLIAQTADVLITTEKHTVHKQALGFEHLAMLLPTDVIPVRQPLEALATALSIAAPTDLVLVTGSLYLIGAIRARWYPVELIEAQNTLWPK